VSIKPPLGVAFPLHRVLIPRLGGVFRRTRWASRWRTGQPRRLMCDRNVFERDPLEYARIAQPFHGVEDLNASQMSIGIVVGSNAFSQVLRGNGRRRNP
jgi:hypothetical protein